MGPFYYKWEQLLQNTKFNAKCVFSAISHLEATLENILVGFTTIISKQVPLTMIHFYHLST